MSTFIGSRGRACSSGTPRSSSAYRQTSHTWKKHETNWNLHELRVSSATAVEVLFAREGGGRAYLLPLSLLVENYDHQLWVVLVAVFGEGQVPALPRHIHHVPESERRAERGEERGQRSRGVAGMDESEGIDRT